MQNSIKLRLKIEKDEPAQENNKSVKINLSTKSNQILQ
jgi:hypothetical protein